MISSLAAQIFPEEQSGYRFLPRNIFLIRDVMARIRLCNIWDHPIPNMVISSIAEGPGAECEGEWTWTPGEEAPDISILKVQIGSGWDFSTLTTEALECRVTDPSKVNVSGHYRWLAIGDSLTRNGEYIAEALSLLGIAMPSIKIETIGTQCGSGVRQKMRHEGRGGWCWRAYLEGEPPAFKTRSPFLFASDNQATFDFHRYILENAGGEYPDFVTLFLGTNDLFGLAPAYSYQAITEAVMRAIRLVDLIREAAPLTQIGILLPLQPSGQDGFGANYGTGVTLWQYRRVLQVYIREMLHAFDEREDEGIYLIATHLAFDSRSAYPLLNGRFNNALHPIMEGYRPIGEGIAAWMLYLLQRSSHSMPHADKR